MDKNTPPTAERILSTLVRLLEDQEGVKVEYSIKDNANTREQLKLMDEIRKKNDASIAKYIEQMRVEAASHTTEQTAMTQGQEA